LVYSLDSYGLPHMVWGNLGNRLESKEVPDKVH